MNNSKSLTEMIEEMDEDLQLQANMLLTDPERNQLKQSGFLFVTQERVQPFLTAIRQYLKMTALNDRVWSLCRIADIGNNMIFNYVFLIRDQN